MQISADQLQQILQHTQSPQFNWVQGAMALGATVVSVTGVVVGMRSSIHELAKQLDRQGSRIDNMADIVNTLNQQIAVIKYAMGVEFKEKTNPE